MNKIVLCSGLLSIILNNSINAAPSNQPTQTNSKQETQAVNNSPNTSVPNNTTSSTASQQLEQISQPIDCNYKIPAETTTIEQSIVTQWAEKAAQQSFNLNYRDIDRQLLALKACYTEQGWHSFNEALQKSGNENAIKAQKLIVSSTVDGKSVITTIKENQWKINIPLQVMYQNEKNKVNQSLTVDLIIGRKISGDLGIMQLIASPRQVITTTPPNPSGTNNTAPVTPIVQH